MSTKTYALIVFLIVLGILSSFYSGYLLNNLFKKNSQQVEGRMIPYFSDELIIVTKNSPHYTLVAYSSRSSKINSVYSHRQKVFFFNGKDWQKNSANLKSNSPDIVKTAMIPVWNIQDDPTRVLKQQVNGTVQVNADKIEFSVPIISNELGIRSQAEYTIFRSEAPGILTINGKKYESYVLYSRTYSYASAINMIEVTDQVGINTDLVAFWDIEGNFYNVDKTTVDQNYKGEYKSHSIAIYKDREGKVQKSFETNIQKKENRGYNIDILEKISKSLNIDIVNTTSKNIGTSPYFWNMGQIKGNIINKNGEKIEGFGIYEQLYQ